MIQEGTGDLVFQPGCLKSLIVCTSVHQSKICMRPSDPESLGGKCQKRKRESVREVVGRGRKRGRERISWNYLTHKSFDPTINHHCDEKKKIGGF